VDEEYWLQRDMIEIQLLEWQYLLAFRTAKRQYFPTLYCPKINPGCGDQSMTEDDR
jgi:hypothetical protein